MIQNHRMKSIFFIHKNLLKNNKAANYKVLDMQVKKSVANVGTRAARPQKLAFRANIFIICCFRFLRGCILLIENKFFKNQESRIKNQESRIKNPRLIICNSPVKIKFFIRKNSKFFNNSNIFYYLRGASLNTLNTLNSLNSLELRRTKTRRKK